MASDGIGVAVISYHSLPDLRRFLKSFRDSDPAMPVHLVIAIVEGDNDEYHEAWQLTAELNATVGLRGFTENVGYGFACNAAAGIWQSDERLTTYAFFNADTELRPGVLEACHERLWSDPTYGVVGPRQVDRQGLITHAGIVGPPPRHRAFKVPGKDTDYTDVLDDCWSVMGSAYFTKAPLWWELSKCPAYRQVTPDALGAFLQTGHFFEDEFYSRHAVAHGRKVVYDGTVTMVHQQGGATPGHGWAVAAMQKARPLYEAACAAHGIPSA